MLVAAVWVGALVHQSVPLVVAAAVVAVALLARRPVVLVLGGALLASTLGARAWAGMGPIAPAPYEGLVTLVADPTALPFGTEVDVRVGHRRVQLVAGGSAGGALSTALAGERVWVQGRLAPPPDDAPWLVPRHVVGRLNAERVERADAGAAPWRAANRFRRLLSRGAEALPEPSRSLYGGFVLGDERGQPPEIVDDFRGSGLTHVLVVSGQNVAFVLVLVRPLTTRFGLGGRWAVTIAVIAAFGVVTRFEPSVLRASAMAALAVSAALAGRPAGTGRILALSVAALVLVDPLLVHSVGFQLSAAASAGIALFSRRVARRIPGPALLAEAVGVTVAAQMGVAPVLVPRFGGLPVVSLVANVLAVPVAGLVTTWGLPAGVVAGLGGPHVAALAHVPTRLLVSWVAGVARVASSVPLGELGLGVLAIMGGALFTSVVVADRWPRMRAVRWGLVALAGAVLISPALALRISPMDQSLPGGGELWRSGGATVLVLTERPRPADLLQDLRRAGTRKLDLVVAPGGLDDDLARALQHRWPLGAVLDAEAGPSTARVGPLEIDIGADGVVTVSTARSTELIRVGR